MSPDEATAFNSVPAMDFVSVLSSLTPRTTLMSDKANGSPEMSSKMTSPPVTETAVISALRGFSVSPTMLVAARATTAASTTVMVSRIMMPTTSDTASSFFMFTL